MDRETRTHELAALHREYAGYFLRCDLVAAEDAPRKDREEDIYARILQKKKTPASHLVIETKEGKLCKVTVGANGWYLCDDSSSLYETFEALFQHLSPGFRDEFAGRLAARLDSLADAKNSE